MISTKSKTLKDIVLPAWHQTVGGMTYTIGLDKETYRGNGSPNSNAIGRFLGYIEDKRTLKARTESYNPGTDEMEMPVSELQYRITQEFKPHSYMVINPCNNNGFYIVTGSIKERIILVDKTPPTF